ACARGPARRDIATSAGARGCAASLPAATGPRSAASGDRPIDREGRKALVSVCTGVGDPWAAEVRRRVLDALAASDDIYGDVELVLGPQGAADGIAGKGASVQPADPSAPSSFTNTPRRSAAQPQATPMYLVGSFGSEARSAPEQKPSTKRPRFCEPWPITWASTPQT